MNRSIWMEIIGLVVAILACIAAYLALIPEDKRWPFKQALATLIDRAAPDPFRRNNLPKSQSQ